MKQIGRFRVKGSKIIKVSIIMGMVTQIYKHVWITLHFHEYLLVVWLLKPSFLKQVLFWQTESPTLRNFVNKKVEN